MGLFKYTTEIAAEKTLGEITGMLAKAGAQRISSDYDNGVIVAIEFTIELDGAPQAFRLKANPAGALAAMRKDRAESRFLNDAQARRVSWRIMREWVSVQTALVECQQASLAQIFFPYAVAGNAIAYEAYREQRAASLGLPAPARKALHG